jgi:hypothetical protein
MMTMQIGVIMANVLAIGAIVISLVVGFQNAGTKDQIDRASDDADTAVGSVNTLREQIRAKFHVEPDETPTRPVQPPTEPSDLPLQLASIELAGPPPDDDEFLAKMRADADDFIAHLRGDQ